MKKFIVSISFCAVILVLFACNIFACTCSLPFGNNSFKKEIKEAYKNSSAVFSGEVIEVIKKPEVYSVEVKFKVNKSWKGDLDNIVTISSGLGSGDCGYKFQVGKIYLVYAYGGTDFLGTNICTRTSFVELNKDITYLSRINKPKIKSSPK